MSRPPMPCVLRCALYPVFSGCMPGAQYLAVACVGWKPLYFECGDPTERVYWVALVLCGAEATFPILATTVAWLVVDALPCVLCALF